MFKSHRNSAPPVSPLEPPPASTLPMALPNGTGRTNGAAGAAGAGGQQYGSVSSMGTVGSMGHRLLPGGPNGPGGPGGHLDLQRVATGGSVNSKSEKRRSGFFGLGGKKDKSKGKVEEPARPSSFLVERPMAGGQQRPEYNHQSLSSNRLPPPPLGHGHSPLSQHSSPPIQQGHPPQQAQTMYNRGPSIPEGLPSDFGPSPNTDPSNNANPRFGKSQSMGFANVRQNSSGGGGDGVPETYPYRGHLNAQQEKAIRGDRSTMPRSRSLALDTLEGNSSSPRPEDMRGSPRMVDGPASPGAGREAGWKKPFDAVVEMIGVQPQKTYVASPPELEMILARTSAGGQPKQGQPGSVSNDWDIVWLQLSGISLSMWSMKETRAAAARGEKVPPTNFNITDSSLELLAPLPPPPHRPNSHPHHYVFSLNTAGSNRLLFSCPSERDLARWATGLRLAAWERAKLEEIYTGHLIKSGGREPPSTLTRRRMEGWVRVRVMGGTDWKRLWVVLSMPASEDREDEKKGRRRSLFGLGEKEKEVVQEPNTGVSMASFYLEPRTLKNKTSVAVLTITSVTQAYAVFPERLEVMAQSNLMKVVGRIGGELVTIEGRLRDSGWALIMPESVESGSGTSPSTPLSNMLPWVTGFHDVFGLYGRPDRYSWDPKDVKSMFFAYPHGPERNRLFLELDEAMLSDFRSSNLPTIRAAFNDIVRRRVTGPAEEYRGEEDQQPTPRPDGGSYRLPALQFGSENSASQPQPPVETSSNQSRSQTQSGPRSLTPITEHTDIASRTNSQRTAASNFATSERPPTKQTSSSSSKYPISGPEERLAPISDSSESVNQLTDEPETTGTQTVPTPTTAESGTGNTLWSRSSGQTPIENMSPVVSGGPGIPQPFTSKKLPPSDPDLPDLPSRAQPRLPAGAAPLLADPLAGTKPVLAPTPRRSVELPSPTPVTAGGLHDEPTAMYLMNMVNEPKSQVSSTNAATSSQGSHLSPVSVAYPSGASRQTPSPERVRPTIITSFDGQKPVSSDSLGRKPSGARALPPKKASTGSSRQLEAIGDEVRQQPSEGQPQRGRMASTSTNSDFGEDAAQFIAYADQPSPAKPVATQPIFPTNATSPPQPQEEMRSSFAPSKAAEERRAKAEAAAVEQQRAMNVPGGGKRVAPRAGVNGGKDTWSGSEDEDEAEADEDEHSPVVHTAGGTLPLQPASRPPVQRQVSQTRALPPVPRPNGGDYSRERPNSTSSNLKATAAPERLQSSSPAQPHRQLPQPGPALGSGAGYGASLVNHSQPTPLPTTNRQTVWNANFAAEHGMDAPKSGKFVDLDEPPTQLTKAFAPHGLLQAGMQDKEDRSAKKQEELAREMGSSLINVPSKPPPPQTGLLGAVAAHERDRKNPGGIGATLTDREREKRLAEERQRDIEKLQRQQMEHMRQYGGDMNSGMYDGGGGGGGGGGGQYPYGMNMGMMGMPPMGYNPYQGGYNPYAQQHAMMAAQMAYHQAMMSMSTSGSQHGGGVGVNGVTGANGGGSQFGAQSTDLPSSPTGSVHPGVAPSATPSMGGGNGYPFPGMYGWGSMPQPQMWGGSSPSPGMQPGMSMPGMGMPGIPGMQGMGMSGVPGMGMPGSMGDGSGSGADNVPGWLSPHRVNAGMSTPWTGSDGPRSRVTSMISDGGQGVQQASHGQNQPAN